MAFVSIEELQKNDRAPKTKEGHKGALKKWNQFFRAPSDEGGLGQPNYEPQSLQGYR